MKSQLYCSQEAQPLKSHDSSLHSLPMFFSVLSLTNVCLLLSQAVSFQVKEGGKEGFFSIFSEGEKKEETWCRMIESENCGLSLIEAVLKCLTACPCIFLPSLHRKKSILHAGKIRAVVFHTRLVYYKL